MKFFIWIFLLATFSLASSRPTLKKIAKILLDVADKPKFHTNSYHSELYGGVAYQQHLNVVPAVGVVQSVAPAPPVTVGVVQSVASAPPVAVGVVQSVASPVAADLVQTVESPVVVSSVVPSMTVGVAQPAAVGVASSGGLNGVHYQQSAVHPLSSASVVHLSPSNSAYGSEVHSYGYEHQYSNAVSSYSKGSYAG